MPVGTGPARTTMSPVIDDTGSIRARFAIGHDEASLRGLLDDLAALTAPADLPVAIERPDGSDGAADFETDLSAPGRNSCT